MCQSNYKAKMLIGQNMDVLAAVGTKETRVTLDVGYGNILGISIGETYTRTELGQVTLSLKAGSKDILINAPLTQFLPDGDRQMWPLNINKGTEIKAVLTINVATLLVAKPIPLIFHTEGDVTFCSN